MADSIAVSIGSPKPASPRGKKKSKSPRGKKSGEISADTNAQDTPAAQNVGETLPSETEAIATPPDAIPAPAVGPPSGGDVVSGNGSNSNGYNNKAVQPEGGLESIMRLLKGFAWPMVIVILMSVALMRSSNAPIVPGASSVSEPIYLELKANLSPGTTKTSVSHYLEFDASGNLVLGLAGGKKIWESNTSQEGGCKKCKAYVEQKKGNPTPVLHVKNGKNVLGSFPLDGGEPFLGRVLIAEKGGKK